LSILLGCQSIDIRPANCTLERWPGNQQVIAIAIASNSVTPSKIEREIISEMNIARTNPQSYANVAIAWRQKFQGNRVKLSERLFLETKEGTAAVDEAISFLKSAPAVPSLTPSPGLSLAARDRMMQGMSGNIAHVGTDGSTPFDRMARYGKFKQIAGENIAFGADSARAVVRDLIIDDGVPNRGHRTNMFRQQYRVAGVSCGPHRTYRILCVINYAGGYAEGRSAK
jgi:uncharacterized protein YkwD